MIGSDKLNGCIKEILVLADVLDSMAKQKGTELIVSSGKRDNVANAQCGGSSTSLHLFGKAIDWSFKDSNIFKVTSEIFGLVQGQQGAFKGITQMEICRAIDGTNHCHLGFGNEGFIKYFTGVYNVKN